MIKRIFIMGQCTLHWGRMEFGNIGNYYIVEPMFRELRKIFPNTVLATTMQFSNEFCDQYNIDTVPMELYYDFRSPDNLYRAQMEYNSVCENLEIDSEYINEIKKSDLIIDFSGDIWGDNAEFLGDGRFLTGLYKDLTAQKLRPTIMFSGSPGPFNSISDLEFVKKVFSGFDLVINREPVSTDLLKTHGFDLRKVKEFPCPSFLFTGNRNNEVSKKMNYDKSKLKIGVILCGWNFEKAPYDLWPREDSEYDLFVKMLENLINKFEAKIYLLSHSNGFDIPPAPFVLKHGRDFPIVQQLNELMCKKGYSESICLLDGIYTPAVTKGMISGFDVLISGRIHGAIAGLSQEVPTAIIDYGHEPKAHKLTGFSKVAGVENYIADPNDYSDLIEKTEACVKNRKAIHEDLKKKMIQVKKDSEKQFAFIKQLFSYL